MQDFVVDFYKTTNVLDIAYLVITIFTLIGCYKRGFVLSILSMAKWFLAYIITLIIFPRAKPYLKGIIDNEYVLDVVLGVSLFIIIIFLILSKFIPTIYFGIFTGLAMLLAMVSVLTLLPSLILLIKPFNK